MLTTAQIKQRSAEAGDSLPLLTIEEFFAGNDHDDSIAPNQFQVGRPALPDMARWLTELEARPDVAWVRVQLVENMGDFRDDQWPKAKAVAVATQMDPDDLSDMVIDELAADGAFEGWIMEPEYYSAVPDLPDGHRVVTIFWG